LTCPDQPTWEQFLAGSLATDAQARIADHLDRCPRCLARLDGPPAEAALLRAALALTDAEMQWLRSAALPARIVARHQHATDWPGLLVALAAGLTLLQAVSNLASLWLTPPGEVLSGAALAWLAGALWAGLVDLIASRAASPVLASGSWLDLLFALLALALWLGLVGRARLWLPRRLPS